MPPNINLQDLSPNQASYLRSSTMRPLCQRNYGQIRLSQPKEISATCWPKRNCGTRVGQTLVSQSQNSSSPACGSTAIHLATEGSLSKLRRISQPKLHRFSPATEGSLSKRCSLQAPSNLSPEAPSILSCDRRISLQAPSNLSPEAPSILSCDRRISLQAPSNLSRVSLQPRQPSILRRFQY
ncbi:hypothetical protein Bca4012_019997 [Brassica carinata]